MRIMPHDEREAWRRELARALLLEEWRSRHAVPKFNTVGEVTNYIVEVVDSLLISLEGPAPTVKQGGELSVPREP